MIPYLSFNRLPLTVGFFLFAHLISNAQGCSDAGFCTMGAMRPNQSFSSKKTAVKVRSIELLQYVGVTKFDDVIMTSLADLNVGIGKKGSLQFKLPYTFVSGPLANTNGFSDIVCSYTHVLLMKRTFQVSGTLGGKLPTNNSNLLSSDNRALPMYYQSSLGTYDLVFGLALVSRKWLLATGYQMPFNQNGSQFTWAQWNGSELKPVAVEYPPSWNLKRGNDIMFRVERNFRSTKWNAYVGLLTIYRINEDVISKVTADNRVEVANTTGAAVTALFGVGYRFSTALAIKAMYGDKLINRETNPDGLSREYVTSLSLEIRL